MPSAVALKLHAAREKQSKARKGKERNQSSGNDGVEQQVNDEVIVDPGATDARKDDVSSSTDDSDSIPPDPSHVRPNPYEIGPTLQSSPERRAAAPPASRKRGRSEIGLEESAPKVKRRLFSGTRARSGIDDRKGETSAATVGQAPGRVGPGVLNVLNQGIKRLQGASKRTFTIDLPSKRSGQDSQGEAPDRSAGLREGAQQSLTASWPSVREEAYEEEQEVEKEAETVMAEHLLAGGDEDQQGEAGDRDDGKGVPVPQLFEPPTPSQMKLARKSKPRKPKTAFEDRPPAEQAIPVKPRSYAKHPSSKPPVRHHEETDTTEHVRKLFQGDHASPVDRQQRRDYTDDLNEPEIEARPDQHEKKGGKDILTDEGHNNDELDEDQDAVPVNLNSSGHSVTPPSVVAPTESPVAIAATQAAFNGPRVKIPLVKVRSMMMDMASRNWTGHGKGWMEEELDKVSFDGPTNATVLGCWEYLVNLRRKWARTPRYPKVAEQYRFAQQESDTTRKETETILSSINEICKQLVQEGNRDDREILQKEVIEFIVPWLVLLLRQFALLGGSTEKVEGRRQVPDVGTFIEPAVQLLAHVCRWLLHIHNSLARNINLELEAWAESSGPSNQPTRVQVAGKRLKLHSAIAEFKDQVRKALEYFKTIREEPIRRAKIAQREAEVSLKKEQEEEAERKRRQARAEAMRKSNERLRQAPDPLVEKWLKKVEGEKQIARFIADQQLGLVQQQRAVQRQQPALPRKTVQQDEFDGYFSSSPGPPQLGAGSSAVRQSGDTVHRGQRQTIPTRQTARSAFLLSVDDDDGQCVAGPSTRKWEPEEDEFLIAELISHSGQQLRPNDYKLWAQVLDREVSEVQIEVTRLKVAARMVAEQRGLRIPQWAEKPDP